MNWAALKQSACCHSIESNTVVSEGLQGGRWEEAVGRWRQISGKRFDTEHRPLWGALGLVLRTMPGILHRIYMK